VIRSSIADTAHSCPTFQLQTVRLLSHPQAFVPASPCPAPVPAPVPLSKIYKTLVPLPQALFNHQHLQSCKHSVLPLNLIRTLISHKMDNILKEGEQMMEGGNNNNSNQGQSNDNQSSNDGSNQQQSSSNSGGGGFMSGMKQNTEDAYINNGKLFTMLWNYPMLIPPQRQTAS
jgi:hypothetical protein